MDEGVAQLFTSTYNDRKIIGTVGELQFEVIQYRLKHEYGASCRFEPLDVYKAVWVTGDEDRLADLRKRKSQSMAKDKDGRDVFLAKSEWMLKVAQDDYPELSFHFSSEF
jgi:peptide chain release factor 3